MIRRGEQTLHPAGLPSRPVERTAGACSGESLPPSRRRTMRGIAFSRLLMLVVLVPLAGLAIFGARLTYDSWARYSDLSRASSVVRLAVVSARFAGIAVPGEGSLNRDMILGRADRSQIEPKRRVTDEIFRDLREAGTAATVQAARLQ